jgi:hypothetical protein
MAFIVPYSSQDYPAQNLRLSLSFLETFFIRILSPLCYVAGMQKNVDYENSKRLAQTLYKQIGHVACPAMNGERIATILGIYPNRERKEN